MKVGGFLLGKTNLSWQPLYVPSYVANLKWNLDGGKNNYKINLVILESICRFV